MYNQSNALIDAQARLAKQVGLPRAKEIITDTSKQCEIVYHTGPTFTSCEICEKEIDDQNPGRRIKFNKEGRRHEVHQCDKCFEEAKEVFFRTKHEFLMIEPFSWWFYSLND